MRKELSLLAILLVFGAAFSLSYNLINVKDTGYPGETLSYNLTIYNNENSTRVVNVFLPTVAMTSINPNNFQLAPGKSQNVKITYTIPINTQPGTYFIGIRINGQQTNMHLRVVVLRPESEYQKIEIKSIRGTSFDPREGGNLQLVVNNPVAIVSAKFNLITPFGNQTRSIILQKGDNTLYFKIKVPNKTEPKEYPIKIIMYVHGIEKEYDSSLKIIGYSTCNVQKSESNNWLMKRVVFKVNNDGTSNGTCTVTAYLNSFDQLFLGSISGGYNTNANEYVWHVNVGPGETKEVYYEVTYYSIYIAAAVAVAAVALYFWMTKTVKVKKSLIEYKKGKGFMDLKIQISVRNMKNKTIKDVVVLEHIPTLVREVKEFGTMKGEVVKIKGKRYIKWVIDELKPKEEIFLSYKVRTSLEVIGDLAFDPTIVKFKYNGKDKEFKSNVLIISTE